MTRDDSSREPFPADSYLVKYRRLTGGGADADSVGPEPFVTGGRWHVSTEHLNRFLNAPEEDPPTLEQTKARLQDAGAQPVPFMYSDPQSPEVPPVEIWRLQPRPMPRNTGKPSKNRARDTPPNPPGFERIVRAVRAERQRQKKLYDHRETLSHDTLLRMMVEELREADEALTRRRRKADHFDRINEEIIQSAAVGWQWLEKKWGLNFEEATAKVREIAMTGPPRGERTEQDLLRTVNRKVGDTAKLLETGQMPEGRERLIERMVAETTAACCRWLMWRRHAKRRKSSRQPRR